MELWELQAREAVRDTVARYSHAVDSGRFDDLVALFTTDATLEVEGEAPYAGREAIRSFLDATARDLAGATTVPVIRHHVADLLVDVVGPSEALARSYFSVITERGLDHWGRYRDRLVGAADRWLFAHRFVRTDGWAPGSWVAERRDR